MNRLEDCGLTSLLIGEMMADSADCIISGCYVNPFKGLSTISNQVNWVILMASQVNCGFMLFNMIPLQEGEFLNFDCSVPPSKRRNLAPSQGALQSPL